MKAKTRRTNTKRLHTPLEDTLEFAAVKAANIKATTTEYYEDVVDYVQTNPVKSALIAGVAGFLVGSILKR